MAHFVSKSDTPPSVKDLWETPKSLYQALNDEFQFDIDICASEKNALCDDYFTIHNSALDNEWELYDNAICFMNPPYSQTAEFIERAAQQSKRYNLTVVALVNANTDTKWFNNAVATANEVRLITGRIGFVNHEGKAASGNTKGQCVIIWRGRCKTPCQITLVNRDSMKWGE